MARKGENINGVVVKSGRAGKGFPKGAFIGEDNNVYSAMGKLIKDTDLKPKNMTSAQWVKKYKLPLFFHSYRNADLEKAKQKLSLYSDDALKAIRLIRRELKLFRCNGVDDMAEAIIKQVEAAKQAVN